MSDNTSANRRLAKNSVVMSVRMVIVLVVSLYTTRVVLNVLGVDDYGLYNVVAGFVLMFTFLNSAMSSATQRFYNVELGKNGIEGARLVYCSAFRIHLIIGVAVTLAAELFGTWYIPNEMVLPEGQLNAAMWIFHFSVISLFLNVIYTPYMAAVMAHERMGFYAGVEIINVLLKLGMALVLPIIPGSKLIWYGLYNLLISALVLALYYGYSKKNFEEIRLGTKVPGVLFKDMMTFCGWNIFGAIAYTLRDQGVNLVLNSFFGTVVNAARGISNQVNGALQGFIGNLVTPARPQVIQSFSRGEIARSWNLTFSVSKMSLLFFLLMALPICFEIDYILKLWLGDDVPQYTSVFVILLLVTNTFGTLMSPISTMVQACGKLRYYSILSSSSNLMTVPLAYLFLKFFDTPELVYIALFITMSTNVLAGLISAHKYAYLSYRAYCNAVIVPCMFVICCSVPIGFICTYLFPPGLLRLIAQFVICTAWVSALSYVLAFNKNERIFVVKFITKIFRRNGSE